MLRKLLTSMFFVISLSSTSASGQPASAVAKSLSPVMEFLTKEVGSQWAGTSSYDCKTYESKNIELLNPRLAEGAAVFIREWSALYTDLVITSAHRTKKEQVCVCDGEKGPCAGRVHWVKNKKGRKVKRGGGTSRHQLGMAVDLRPQFMTLPEYRCMHEFADLNPWLGVTFPHGDHDKPHMELSQVSKRIRFESLEKTSGTPKVVPCKSLAVQSHDIVD